MNVAIFYVGVDHILYIHIYIYIAPLSADAERGGFSAQVTHIHLFRQNVTLHPVPIFTYLHPPPKTS